jgi:hypothetical protein
MREEWPQVNISQEIDDRISGCSMVYYTGSPNKIDEEISGSGDLQKAA